MAARSARNRPGVKIVLRIREEAVETVTRGPPGLQRQIAVGIVDRSLLMSLETLIPALVNHYGLWLLAVIVGLESAGLPLPGETTLVATALYAGATGRLHIASVVIAAAAGAMAGDNIGYWIGRRVGYPWILRHQSKLHLTPRRLKLGQYLFYRHGGKVVFFGRFVALLRALAGLLAGINGMPWQRFLFFNAAGGALWASVFGFGAYLFGRQLTDMLKAAGVLLAIAAAVLVVIGLIVVRRHEERWADVAERALPEALQP
jgi:membrane protein DedA with SNARE-associated domain